MPLKEMNYAAARPKMQAGDVIAFGGKSHFSDLIKTATGADVSHVGVILQTCRRGSVGDGIFNQIVESTLIGDFNGVQVSRLSERINDHDGELWWLPLNRRLRRLSFDQKRFYDFLFSQAKSRKPYDMGQAVRSALDLVDDLPFGLKGPTYNREDFQKFFCSELVAAGLQRAGAVPAINSSEVTPIDLCRWNIYSRTYYRLKGASDKRISRYNTIDPKQWAV